MSDDPRYRDRVNLVIEGYDPEILSLLTALADLDDLPDPPPDPLYQVVEPSLIHVDFLHARQRRGQ